MTGLLRRVVVVLEAGVRRLADMCRRRQARVAAMTRTAGEWRRADRSPDARAAKIRRDLEDLSRI
ncbi:hypothetical protein [Nonomuraea jabiensis]|uniref:hypothetical protein n=1 Tax=Nonomuraea jabiensis TaxID=882448 RepID=UPI003D75F74A